MDRITLGQGHQMNKANRGERKGLWERLRLEGGFVAKGQYFRKVKDEISRIFSFLNAWCGAQRVAIHHVMTSNISVGTARRELTTTKDCARIE
jgi:hypothetical protein